MPDTHAYADRQSDLQDAYRGKVITREQFIKLLSELNDDYYESCWQADQIRKEPT